MLSERAPAGRVITVGGADSTSLRGLAEAIRDQLGSGLVVPVPLVAMRAVAVLHRELGDKLDELYENKTLSREELAEVCGLLGREPRSLLDDLPAVIASVRAHR